MTQITQDNVHILIQESIESIEMILNLEIVDLQNKIENLKKISIDVFADQLIAAKEEGYINSKADIIKCIKEVI